MVILGNPPYSNFGMMNKNDWITDLLKEYKRNLNEKKLNLDDDFIKFIRFGQWRIEQTGAGVLAFITNNTYIDGITHRRMRQSLLETFSDIYILDLHGSSKKKDKCPNGSKDENVFDIQQGVAISIFVKKPGKQGPAKVHHAEVWGTRKSKYAVLAETDIQATKWAELKPKADHFFFVPKEFAGEQEYHNYTRLIDILLVNSSGIQTKRDKVAIAQNKTELLRRLKDFSTLEIEEIRFKYGLPADGRDWKIVWAAEHASQVLHEEGNALTPLLYRPFDVCWTVIDKRSKGFVAYPRYDVMHNMKHPNRGFVFTRQLSLANFNHVWVTQYPIDGNTISLQTREYNYLFPLYLYPQTEIEKRTGAGRRPNFAPAFIKEFAERLGMEFINDGKGDRSKTFGPEDIFDYMYAVFHSPNYRSRYAEFLKIDFPRLPLTSNAELFRELCAIGSKLVALHLMDVGAGLKPAPTTYPIAGDNNVENVRYEEPSQWHRLPACKDRQDACPTKETGGRVWINKTQYFEGVPPEVWNFHVGGYQVCQKWLKDRKGRKLTYDDLTHYQHIVAALAETIRLMGEIDRVVEEQGGWPIR